MRMKSKARSILETDRLHIPSAKKLTDSIKIYCYTHVTYHQNQFLKCIHMHEAELYNN